MLKSIKGKIVYLSMVLVVMPSLNVPGTTTVGKYIWRGEYKRALNKSNGHDKDTKARLMLINGKADTAYELLVGEKDNFRKGLAAFKAGKHQEALRYLEKPVGNDFLEGYRLLLIGKIFFNGLSFESSAQATAKFIRNYNGNTLPPCEFYREGCDIFVISCLNKNYKTNLVSYANNYDLILSPFVKIHLSRAYLDWDMPEKALEMYTEAVSGKDGIESANTARYTEKADCSKVLEYARALGYIKTEEYREAAKNPETFSERVTNSVLLDLTGELITGFGTFNSEDLSNIISDLLEEGHLRSAELMVNILSQTDELWLARYLRGRYLEESGRPIEATRIFGKIFHSHASVELKKDALTRMAKIAYRRGKFSKAVKYYRTFGMYYPGDRRSLRSLDIAARIEVIRGNYGNATKIWDKIPEIGYKSKRAFDAALSNAVLNYFINNKLKSYRLLKDLSGVDNYRKDGVFYWLSRTCPSEQEDYWLTRLTSDYPESFYAKAALWGSESPMFVRDNNIIINSSGLYKAEQTEREFYDSCFTDTESKDILRDNDLYRSFRYFMINGFHDEARICVELLIHRFIDNRDVLMEICRYARREGFLYPVISILHSGEFYGRGNNIPEYLRYPIAYTDLIYDNCSRRRIPVELIMSVVKAESSFDHRAFSRAGAMGLMQFMPSTATWIGKKMGEEDITEEQIYSPDFNIGAGVYYLDYLLDRNDDSVVAALAGYNAGLSKMSRWRKQFNPNKNPILAVELIGIQETRNYVKKVLNYMSVYTAITGGDHSWDMQ